MKEKKKIKDNIKHNICIPSYYLRKMETLEKNLDLFKKKVSNLQKYNFELEQKMEILQNDKIQNQECEEKENIVCDEEKEYFEELLLNLEKEFQKINIKE
jgi:hypothetical protein